MRRGSVAHLQEFLENLHQMFNAVEVIQIQSGRLSIRELAVVEGVSEINHFHVHPLLVLIVGADEIVQHLLIITFHVAHFLKINGGLLIISSDYQRV